MIVSFSFLALLFYFIRLAVLQKELILICKQPMSLLEFLVQTHSLSPSSHFFILDLQMFSQTGKILFHSSSR